MRRLAYVKMVTSEAGWGNHFSEIRPEHADMFEVEFKDIKKFDQDKLSGYRIRVFSSQDSEMLEWCEKLDGFNFVCVQGGVRFEVDDYVKDFNDELAYVSRLLKEGKIRGVFCNTTWQAENLSENFSMDRCRVFVTGFPISSCVINRYRTQIVEEKLIMCPGRFDPEKTLPLYVHALFPLVKEGYRIVFTTNVKKDDMARFDPQMSLFMACVERRGMEVHWGLSVDAYYSLLSKAESVVVRGLADSFNIVAVESAYLGRNVVCPDIPPYDELFISGLFRAFDERQIRSMVKDREGAVLKESSRYMDYNVLDRQFDIARTESE